jgi:copper transport protein
MHIRRVFAAAALACVFVVASATTASAHAVLLRTDPVPQSTVARPPSQVRLSFSESVEVNFGAIRVFDVNGKRADDGTVRHAGRGSEVVVTTPHLHNGTYTVTWRVVSADGHPVHGGFVFYVGAPSSISPVAISGDTGAGRVVGWGFGVVRFLAFAALFLLVGGVVFRRWVWTPALTAAHLRDSEAAGRFRRWFGRILVASWAVLLVTGVAGIVFEGASVSGFSLLSAAKSTVIRSVLHTAYGHFALLQLGLTALLALPVFGLVRRRRLFGVAPDAWVATAIVLGAGISLAIGLNGHARTDPRPFLDVTSIAVHLLVVAVWVGGLAFFVIGVLAARALAPADRPRALRETIRRFSTMAAAAVGLVIETGVINTWANLAAPGELWRTTYGRVVLAKVVLLAVALVLAARHRWVVPTRLGATDQAAGAERSFGRTSRLELVVLVGAVACAAALVALVPGRSLAAAANGPVNQEQRAAGYTVQLFLDPSSVGANSVHLTFVNSQGRAASEVVNATVSLRGPRAPASNVAMRLISPGHFVGDAKFPVAGQYEVAVTAKPRIVTTFRFNLRA